MNLLPDSLMLMWAAKQHKRLFRHRSSMPFGTLFLLSPLLTGCGKNIDPMQTFIGRWTTESVWARSELTIRRDGSCHQVVDELFYPDPNNKPLSLQVSHHIEQNCRWSVEKQTIHKTEITFAPFVTFGPRGTQMKQSFKTVYGYGEVYGSYIDIDVGAGLTYHPVGR